MPNDFVTLTDAIYFASLPKVLQHALLIKDYKQRMYEVYNLAFTVDPATGFNYKVDFAIMMWGWDALYTMKMRKSFGYTWVPPASRPPIQVAPGVHMPGMPDYDPTVPPWGILVSTDAKDFPAAAEAPVNKWAALAA